MTEPITLRSLRVLILTPKGFLGGAEQWLLALLDGTDRLDPAVICLDDGPLVTALRARGVDVSVVPTGAGARDLAGAALRLRREVKRRDPDVILANGIKSATLGVPVARWLGVPIVWVRHDASYDATLGTLVGRLSRVIMVAPPDEADVRRFDPVYIPPPLGVQPVSRDEARAELVRLGMPDDGRPVLAMCCRLVPHKGIDTAIRALPHAPQWRLVVAGIPDPSEPHDEQARLQALAADEGVADRVTWLGQVPDIGRLDAAFDALAILTRAEPGYPGTENFPLNLMEAYAAGVPVIADPATVPPLRAADYAAGAVPVYGVDPRSVAAALERVQDGAGAAERAAAARSLAAAHPDRAEVARRVVDELAQAAHRPGAGLRSGPPVSVVSTVFNEGEGVDVLCDDILPQLRHGDEFVVVDGGSRDDTVARLSKRADADPRLIVVEAPGAGISEGRNIGVGHARRDWIACSDAGCRQEPTWLDAMRAGAASGRADLVTGVYTAEIRPGNLLDAALAAVAYPHPDELRRQTPLVRVYGRLFGRVYDAALPTGRTVSFAKSAWEAAGGYPEDLATAEDVTFGQRVVGAGGRAVLAQDAGVLWRQRDSFEANMRMLYRYGVGDGQSGDVRLIGRNFARAAAYMLGPVFLAGRRTRPLALAGAALYLSLPLKRALAGPQPVAAAAAVPAISAARDLSKAYGCLVGLRSRR